MPSPARDGLRVPSVTYAAVLSLVLAVGWMSGPRATPARAQAGGFQAMFEADAALAADPEGTIQQLRMLGVQRIRLAVTWETFAPRPHSRQAPRHFRATDPAAYPKANWVALDTVVRDASSAGIGVDLDVLGGAPLWATGPGEPKGTINQSWEPNPTDYQQFVQALGTRYSGGYTPAGASSALPRVSFWSVWNEPDYGPSLAPQGVPGNLNVENSPRMYRNLVAAAWSGLHRTGHGSDTFLIGELAPRGLGYWGVFSGMKPLVFLRALYCVDSRYHELRGSSAAIRGCPTNAAGSRSFRARNPGLFQASGVSDHPYMRWYRPNHEAQPDPDYTTLGEIDNLPRAMDRLMRVYGSSKRYPIWDTEFGYLTSPPKHPTQIEKGGTHYPWISQTTAAYYLNWAEYLSYKNPRIMSFFQYLLTDPLPARRSNDWGGFASGLLTYKGQRKPGYYAWRMPLYLPATSTRRGRPLELWGCARPAQYAAQDTGTAQSVEIQFKPAGHGYSTLQDVTLTDAGKSCYFDVRVAFPSSGSVRLAWTYPSADAELGYFDPLESHTAYSRAVSVAVH